MQVSQSLVGEEWRKTQKSLGGNSVNSSPVEVSTIGLFVYLNFIRSKVITVLCIPQLYVTGALVKTVECIAHHKSLIKRRLENFLVEVSTGNELNPTSLSNPTVTIATTLLHCI
ncbi:hypothetical protein NE237_002735 [Protea cynaroides]|uniref:Uncharacterized protein n=1 Tax=Protea cynaroides TaxID=273540 RepID=A0A9Q0KG22_9MAGN|nr:hypothetical protein NE237_002735 [Protea cynaroides]